MRRIFSAAMLIAAITFPGTLCHAALLVGVTDDDDAISFFSDNPSQLNWSKPITGLAQGEHVIGIDHRPTTGDLYAVGSLGGVYTVNLNGIGQAPATLQFNLNSDPNLIADGGLNGSDFGVDFNPAADFGGASSLRIVSNTNQNLAVNVDTGAVTVATDVFYPAGGSRNIVGEAYSNSIGGGNPNGLNAAGNPNGPGTTQYAIDSGTDGLVIQAFNAGTLTPVGSLGVNATADVGFDIFSLGIGRNHAFATIDDNGSNTSNLFSIDLATGVATDLGVVDGGLLIPHLSAPISGIDPNQIVPEPSTIALAGLGLLVLAVRRKE